MKILAGNREYTVTGEDVLWLKRAVAAEGPDEREVAQVLCNVFALVFSRGLRTTLKNIVRAYAQPVNPRWYPDGDLHEKEVARLGRTGDARGQARELAAAPRRRDVYSARATFSPLVETAVDVALTAGPVDIPPNATDYAAPWMPLSKSRAPLGRPESGVNRLSTRSSKWAGYRVG